jgi:hypothetical protein
MLWLNRWIISFDPGTMKPQLSPVPVNAFILTKDQIQKNIEEILPGYRLIEKPVYEQLTAKQFDYFLQVDYSHRIVHSDTPDEELILTLKSDRRRLYGIYGALIQLLKTSEENKLGVTIAECFNQELMVQESLLAACFKTEVMDSDTFTKIETSLDELDKTNNVLSEMLPKSRNNQFGFSLTMVAEEILRDIWALLDAYMQQTQSEEAVNEAGAA